METEFYGLGRRVWSFRGSEVAYQPTNSMGCRVNSAAFKFNPLTSISEGPIGGIPYSDDQVFFVYPGGYLIRVIAKGNRHPWGKGSTIGPRS